MKLNPLRALFDPYFATLTKTATAKPELVAPKANRSHKF